MNMDKINLSKELASMELYTELAQEYFDKQRELPSNFPLSSLRKDLSSYNWGIPRKVQIPKSDGKSFRDIYIFNEQDSFLLKALNLVFNKRLKHLIHPNVYSYQKGKRTFNATKYVISKIESNKNLHAVKVDISNYFLSVNFETIYKSISDLVEDDKGKLLLLRLFSINKCGFNGNIKEQYLGIMPGSAFSNFLANYVLRPLDDYLESQDVIFARYADDIIIYGDTKEQLEDIIKGSLNVIKPIGLTINPNKIHYYNDDELVEFLGLRINSYGKIDISNKTYTNIKTVIKSLSKSIRKSFEMGKISDKDKAVELFVRTLNKKLYKSIFNEQMAHKSSRMNYVFANINTTDTLKRLDRYTLDCINYVYTGKHNKSPKRLRFENLPSYGFCSCVQLYYLYKLDRGLYLDKVYKLSTPLIKETDRINIYRRFPVETRKHWDKDLISFLNYLLDNNAYIRFGDFQVRVCKLTIDLPNRVIRWENEILVEGNECKVDSLEVFLHGKTVEFELKGIPFYSDESVTPLDETLRLLVGASHLYSIAWSEGKNKVTYGYFRRYSVSFLANNYNEELMQFEKSVPYRDTKFLLDVYAHLASNKLWDGLNYNHNLIKLTDGMITFIIPNEWLNK